MNKIIYRVHVQASLKILIRNFSIIKLTNKNFKKCRVLYLVLLKEIKPAIEILKLKICSYTVKENFKRCFLRFRKSLSLV